MGSASSARSGRWSSMSRRKLLLVESSSEVLNEGLLIVMSPLRVIDAVAKAELNSGSGRDRGKP